MRDLKLHIAQRRVGNDPQLGGIRGEVSLHHFVTHGILSHEGEGRQGEQKPGRTGGHAKSFHHYTP